MEGQKQQHPELQVAVVMVPLPAQGHLNQLLHLSHLISSYGLPVYYAGSSTHNRQAKFRLQGWDSQTLSIIRFHDFELPPYNSPPPNPDPNTHFPTHLQSLFDACIHLREPVSGLLLQLSSKFRRIIVIADTGMAYVIQEAKNIPNAEAYAFNSISAFASFLAYWENLPEKPFQLTESDIAKSIPSNDGCLSPEIFEFIMNQSKLWGFESGMLYNTSRVIEGRYLDLLERVSPRAEVKHFAIGPFNPVKIKGSNNDDKHFCLKWLDNHEENSVIYISFGSVTTMIDEQITELASALEKSGLKFIWVLKTADTGNIFSDEIRKPQLPEGYEERVQEKGIVVRDWAPQLEILAHRSIGGFMSHCGWNSCMESISFGVPIVAWPMHSDQPRNAVLVTDVLKIGILVRKWECRGEVVSSNTIENVLRRLMLLEEGQEVRKRAVELGTKVRATVGKDGTSRLEMDSFIAHIIR